MHGLSRQFMLNINNSMIIQTYNIYIIVTDMEGNIRMYRLPKGRGTDQWKWYRPIRRQGQYHFHWSVPRPKGSLSILMVILLSISVTIVFIALKTRIWHTIHNAQNFFKESRSLIHFVGTAILGINKTLQTEGYISIPVCIAE